MDEREARLIGAVVVADRTASPVADECLACSPFGAFTCTQLAITMRWAPEQFMALKRIVTRVSIALAGASRTAPRTNRRRFGTLICRPPPTQHQTRRNDGSRAPSLRSRKAAVGRYAELSIATPMHMSRLCTGDATLMTWSQHRRGIRRDGHSPNWT